MKIVPLAAIFALTLPAIPAQAQLCYWELPDGQRISLDALCQGQSNAGTTVTVPTAQVPQTPQKPTRVNLITSLAFDKVEVNYHSEYLSRISGVITNVTNKPLAVRFVEFQFEDRIQVGKLIGSVVIPIGVELQPGQKFEFEQLFDADRNKDKYGYSLVIIPKAAI